MNEFGQVPLYDFDQYDERQFLADDINRSFELIFGDHLSNVEDVDVPIPHSKRVRAFIHKGVYGPDSLDIGAIAIDAGEQSRYVVEMSYPFQKDEYQIWTFAPDQHSLVLHQENCSFAREEIIDGCRDYPNLLSSEGKNFKSVLDTLEELGSSYDVKDMPKFRQPSYHLSYFR